MARILDLVLPPACAGCGRVGALLCRECIAGMASPEAGSFVAPDAGVVIGDALTLGIGALAYEGATRRALGRLKYGGASRLAEPLAMVAEGAFARLLRISGPAATVPVPLHPARQRQRGYNQAALLAEHLARQHRLRFVELLARHHATERQHRLDRAARLRNLRDAIALDGSLAIPEVIVVVDDILTTSATLEACAAVLRAGGAREVYGFAVAREV